jgi:3' terminal RNA ribose 2'-O-methyltransferase Hen1
MFLTITSTSDSPSDLGYLLHKHPSRAQSFEMTAGQAHVFYPESTSERCTAALLLEVDPIALVRNRGGRKARGGAGAPADAFSLGQYVNDRPYAASSMLAVALGKVFRTAMTGRCDLRPELAASALPLELHVPALPSTGGAEQVRGLFEPLGWTVEATPVPLDPTVPAWGDSRYVDLRLTGIQLLSQALSHLYVLLPVLDDAKHYWVGDDEVDKLVRAGSGWLADHPERDLITRRYLAHQRDLVHSATDRLIELEDATPDDAESGSEGGSEGSVNEGSVDEPRRRPLAQLRRATVTSVLRDAGAARVADLGCGEGALLRDLLDDPTFTEVLGADVSPRALALAERRLHLERMPDTQRARLTLMQSSLTYRDDRIAGFDAIVLMEVIEHVDVTRLASVERSVFDHASPRTVVVTTPNAEHNVRYPDLAHGRHRHSDHRFEWTRAEFSAWAERVAAQYGYRVEYRPLGDDDPDVGSPTQLAVFTRSAVPAVAAVAS